MEPMTSRERYLATIRFEDTDRPVRFEMGVDDNTLVRWQKEGYQLKGPAPNFFFDFDFDLVAPVMIGAHVQPGFFPEYELKVIKDEANHKIIQTPAGTIQEIFSDGSMSIPRFLKFPVANMDDLKLLMPRLNPGDHARVDNWKWAFGLAAGAKWPLSLYISGCFGFHRHLMGFENLMVAYMEDPELIHEMSKTWEKLFIGVLERAKTHGDVDILYFWEDMCYKNGPMISPKMFKEFILPYYKKVCAKALELGVTGLCVDTDGDCRLLVPLFMEAGVNFMLPFEVQSGMDVREFRKIYPKLAIQGGLDKRALAKTRQDIDAELEAKMSFMLARRGYIASLDHVVPPDVPYENFVYYLQKLRSWK